MGGVTKKVCNKINVTHIELLLDKLMKDGQWNYSTGTFVSCGIVRPQECPQIRRVDVIRSLADEK